MNTPESFESFVEHIDQITILAPVAYHVDEEGIVRGRVDMRTREIARARGVKVMPLVQNRGFNQLMLQRLLRSDEARRRAVDGLASLCQKEGYWGLQIDFENIHVDDRDRLTTFYRQAANALHLVGCQISIAVIPRTSDSPGNTPYHQWMYTFWRGAYDYGALASAGDFLVLMTYEQHSRHTPPGPVAGLPWVERSLVFSLAQGVPPDKILLGMPAYSRLWHPVRDVRDGGRIRNRGANSRGLSYREVEALVQANDARLQWDDRQKAYHASWENPNDEAFEHIFVENVETFDVKLNLVSSYRLRGLAVWHLGQEDPRVWTRLARRALTARRGAAPGSRDSNRVSAEGIAGSHEQTPWK